MTQILVAQIADLAKFITEVLLYYLQANIDDSNANHVVLGLELTKKNNLKNKTNL